MTPTMVSNSVPILIVLPGAFGLAPRYFCQNAWLTMTDDGAPGEARRRRTSDRAEVSRQTH
jgi:hypothetical protein